MSDLMQGEALAVQGGVFHPERYSRPLGAVALGRAAGALRSAVPLSRGWLEERLESALAEAGHLGAGFYLRSFAVRRAMADGLIIDVDPHRIRQRLQHRIPEAGGVRVIRDRFLGTGDWGPLLDRLDTSSTYQEVREVVEAGLEYRKTSAFQLALQRAGSRRPLCRNFVALKTPGLVERYFRSIVDLVRSISEVGIVRRADFHRVSHIFGNCCVRPPWIEAVESDVGVAIGPRGEIYRFAPGKHRMAIAQTLGLGSMPVEVRIVHADWLRRQVEASGLRPAAALLYGIRRLDWGSGRPSGGEAARQR